MPQQCSSRMNIVQLAGVEGSTFIAVPNPLFQLAHRVTVYNVDGSTALEISTDGTNFLPIATSSNFQLQLSSRSGWGAGEVMFFLKGGVSTQPIIVVES